MKPAFVGIAGELEGLKVMTELSGKILQTQQAQILGLREALEFYMNPEIYLLRATVMTGTPISNAICDAGKIATQALATLPAAFLEREKAREAVVRAAVDSVAKTKTWKEMTMMTEIIDPEIPLKAQKAYEELERTVQALEALEKIKCENCGFQPLGSKDIKLQMGFEAWFYVCENCEKMPECSPS